MSAKSAIAVALLLYIASTVIFFAPVVISDKTFVARDHYLFYNPRQFFVAETIHKRELPLWNPFVACGTPSQASIQSSLFYPLALLYYVLPFQTGFKYYVILHYLLAAFFMFLLMRVWSASGAAAWISGLVFAFGGYCASINDNVAFIASAAWIPMVLLCWDWMLKQQTAASILYSAIAVALQILAGDVSCSLLSSFIMTLFFTLRHIVVHRTEMQRLSVRPILFFGSAWTLGLLLTAAQIVPFAELVQQSHRAGGLSFAQATRWSFHPGELIQLFLPYCFGTIVPGTRWFGQLWLDTIYIGIIPLGCALLYIGTARHSLHLMLLGVLGIGLLLGFGKYSPAYPLLFHIFPGIAMIQYPVKFLLLAHISLSIMAGFGFDILCNLSHRIPTARRLYRILAVGIICLIVALGAERICGEAGYRFFLTFYPKTDYLLPVAQVAWQGLWHAVFVLLVLVSIFSAIAVMLHAGMLTKQVATVTCALVIFIDMLAFGKPQDPYIPQHMFSLPTESGNFLKQDNSLFRIYSLSVYQTQRSFLHVYYMPFERVYRVIRETQQANTNIYEGLHSAEEYSDLLLTRYYDVFSVVERCFSERQTDASAVQRCSSILSLLNVKYIISPFPLHGFPFSLVRDGPVKIYKNPSVLPRAFVVDHVAVCPDDATVLAAIMHEGYQPSANVYITAEDAKKVAGIKDMPREKADAAPPPGSVWIEGYQPSRVLLRASLSRKALLVLADTYYPGWKAFDNGREIPVLRVNHTLRGVVIDPGDHIVIFSFKPTSLKIGVWLTCITVLLCGACAFFSGTKFGWHDDKIQKRDDL
ncbi:MAG: YfhO family protein [Desulfobacterota bacterium]|nr:YfhO family protein [Thermodesulfobacteriota bacterium]